MVVNVGLSKNQKLVGGRMRATLIPNIRALGEPNCQRVTMQLAIYKIWWH